MLSTRHFAVHAVLSLVLGAALTPLSSLPVLMAQSPAAPAQPSNDRVNVLISFRNMPGDADEALVRGAGGIVRHRFHLVRAIAASLPPQAVAALRANPRVAIVEPDVKIFAVDAELDNSWGVKQIGAGTVHANGVRGTGVKVAVIDTGIDCTHPDLAINCAGGWDFVNNDADPFDDNKHGTHVAGIIAAREDALGVVGVAPEAQLYALKVLDQNGQGDFSNVIAALQWAIDHGIQVTNNSYGATQDPGIIAKAAFDNAAAAGIVNVAAAGNSGDCQGLGDNVNWPARYDSVIAVGATDQNNQSPCFSSSGPKVELSAPGVSVNSTVPGNNYEALSGTSMASPHVAALAALIIGNGVTDTNGDGRVNDEVRNILDSTAHDLGSPGRDTWYGFGLVDAVAAIEGPAPPQPAVSTTVTTNKSSYTRGVDTTAELTATVRDEHGEAISGLAAPAFVTALDGAAAAASFSETAPASGIYKATLDISGLVVGSHTALVTVTDSRDIAGTGSASFTVIAPNTVRVKSIAYSTYGGTDGKRNLVISVLIVDGADAPVNKAIVSVIAYRNGFFYGAANGRSGPDGKAVFEAASAPPGCYQTLVAAVIAGSRTWNGATPPNGFCK